MIVTRLKVANVRAIEAAEFRFQPGFNLIVGINGVGKTSVIDALSVCLSAVVRHLNKLRGQAKGFATDDIRFGADALTVECRVRLNEHDYDYLVHKPRETKTLWSKGEGSPRVQILDAPERRGFIGDKPPAVTGREPDGRPLAVLFSTNRAVPSERAPGKGTAAGGVDAAYAEAFANRELRLGEIAAWIKVQEALRSEHQAADQMLVALQSAIERFLPGYSNLRLADRDDAQLVINRGAAIIPVRHLSDGERGTLALALDLTRRLAQANPHLSDPAAEAEAIVLIDELDLHLHPKWQRQIVHNLTGAFPRCQFIATTHSPQIIGEVEHHRIQIIADGQVYSPTHSYGVDSSRVLEEIMDVEPRAEKVQELLTKISRVIGKQEFAEAHKLLEDLIGLIGESDPEVTRIRTLLDFLEGNE